MKTVRKRAADTARAIVEGAAEVTTQTTVVIAELLQDYIKNSIKEHNDNDNDDFNTFVDFIEHNQKNNKYELNKNPTSTNNEFETKIEKLVKKISNNNGEKIKEQILKQIDLKVEYLNTILKKYKKLGYEKVGKEKAEGENKTIKIPFLLSVENRMKKFINSEKMYEPQTQQQILEKQIKSVNNKITSSEILAKNLKKLNIRKKKDYSSFRGIPEDYDPIGVKNEVNHELWNKISQIKNLKSEQSNFGSNPQSEDNINKIKANVSEELIKLINQALGENLLGHIFKPKIDEQRVRDLISAIPNERLQKNMTTKLEKKLKHTQPTSLGDLNREINRDTKELTNNTNKIFDKVKNLVDRINKKDKRIIQLKNELEREKSISGTKLSNNKETFEINKKNLQDQLNARNRELENIENRYSNNHRKLVAQFNKINLQDKSKKEELTRILNETKSNNLKELQELRVTIQNNYNRQLKSVIKNLEQKKNQELEVERNKLSAAEKKAEQKIEDQVNKALQTKREYVKYMNSKKIEYDKNMDKAIQNSSETIKRLEDTCAKQISELKKEHKRFENRVVRVFNDRVSKVKTEANKEISRIKEDYKNNQVNNDKTKDAMRTEIQRVKKLLNDLNTQQTQALRESIKEKNEKIARLKEDAQAKIKEQEERLQRQQKQFKKNQQESLDLKLRQIKSAMDMNKESARKKKEEEEAARKKKEEEEAARKKKEEEEAEKKAKEEAAAKEEKEAARKDPEWKLNFEGYFKNGDIIETQEYDNVTLINKTGGKGNDYKVDDDGKKFIEDVIKNNETKTITIKYDNDVGNLYEECKKKAEESTSKEINIGDYNLNICGIELNYSDSSFTDEKKAFTLFQSGASNNQFIRIYIPTEAEKEFKENKRKKKEFEKRKEYLESLKKAKQEALLARAKKVKKYFPDKKIPEELTEDQVEEAEKEAKKAKEEEASKEEAPKKKADDEQKCDEGEKPPCCDGMGYDEETQKCVDNMIVSKFGKRRKRKFGKKKKKKRRKKKKKKRKKKKVSKRKVSKRKSKAGKKVNKVSSALKRLCKKHGIRLTLKKGNKRVPKSEKLLKKQLAKKLKALKKKKKVSKRKVSKRKSKVGRKVKKKKTVRKRKVYKRKVSKRKVKKRVVKKKISMKIKNYCKKLGIKMTTKRNGKRVYKTEKVLKAQIVRKIKMLKKSKK